MWQADWTEGHIAVCDGYRNGNEIHLNLGWGGAGDLWYNIDSVVYDSFNWTRHEATFGITPPNISLPNDSFATASIIAGTSGQATGSNAEATLEPGEPDHGGTEAGKSVWWQWTSPGNGIVSFNTFGSGFDTVLAVYTRDSVWELTPIAFNDNSGGIQSQVSFNAAAGQIFRIMVGGAAGASGSITLNWQLRSPPTVVTGPAGNVTLDSALVAGQVISDGGAAVTERGVAFATTRTPTIGHRKAPAGSGTGSFTATLAQLTAGTTYYARAYAINSNGIGYGGQISFTTVPIQIVATPLTVAVPEGTTAAFAVTLHRAPIANVTVTVARTNGDTDIAASPNSLVFTASNWNTPQIVTLSAAQDADATNGAAVFTCSATLLTSAVVTATEADDDASLVITAGPGGTVEPNMTVTVTKRTVVMLKATPKSGYAFSNWTVTSGTVTIADPSAANTSVTASASAAITAHFTVLPTEFVAVPAGGFTMGRTSGDADSNAPPVTVTVGAFLLARHETSKSRWDAVRTWAASHGYPDLATGGGEGPDHPVHTVSWWDAVKWCNARSEMEELTPVYTVAGAVMRSGTKAPTVNWSANGYRLPTEAEWEKAARGGAAGLRYAWGDSINHNYANYRANRNAAAYDTSPYTINTPHPAFNDGTEPFTSPAGSFWPNDYGFYDMTGNVMEWCGDWYGASTYASGAVDPRGPATGTYKVYRGGGWKSTAPETRICFRRGFYVPVVALNQIGFRLARTTADDHGNTTGSATPISVGTSRRGELADGDTDCFRVTLPGLGLLIAWSTGTTNTYGEILNAQGIVLAANDDLLHPQDASLLDANFRVSATVTTGDNFIKVTGSAGPYRLQAWFIPEGAPWQTSLLRIVAGGHVVLGIPTSAGTTYQIEWSPDLRTWNHLCSLTGTGAEVIAVLDRHAANHPQRALFRAYSGPLRSGSEIPGK